MSDLNSTIILNSNNPNNQVRRYSHTPNQCISNNVTNTTSINSDALNMTNNPNLTLIPLNFDPIPSESLSPFPFLRRKSSNKSLKNIPITNQNAMLSTAPAPFPISDQISKIKKVLAANVSNNPISANTILTARKYSAGSSRPKSGRPTSKLNTSRPISNISNVGLSPNPLKNSDLFNVQPPSPSDNIHSNLPSNVPKGSTIKSSSVAYTIDLPFTDVKASAFDKIRARKKSTDNALLEFSNVKNKEVPVVNNVKTITNSNSNPDNISHTKLNPFNVGSSPTPLGFKPIKKSSSPELDADFTDKLVSPRKDSANKSPYKTRSRSGSFHELSDNSAPSFQMSGNQWNDLLTNYRKRNSKVPTPGADFEPLDFSKPPKPNSEDGNSSFTRDDGASSPPKSQDPSFQTDATATMVRSRSKILTPLIFPNSSPKNEDEKANSIKLNPFNLTTPVKLNDYISQESKLPSTIGIFSIPQSTFAATFQPPSMNSTVDSNAIKFSSFTPNNSFNTTFNNSLSKNSTALTFTPNITLNFTLSNSLSKPLNPNNNFNQNTSDTSKFPDCSNWSKDDVEKYARELFNQNKFLVDQLLEVAKQRDLATKSLD